MKKLKIKRKGYANGTDSSGVDMGMTPEQLSAYNAAQTQAEKDKIAADAKKLNQIGSAMQAVKIPDVGSGAKSDQYNQSKATADATGATISAGVGAVNPVAGGIINILNEVGTTARESTEKTDEYGVPIKSKESVGTTAALGGLFSPSKALQYRIESGDWTSTSGDKYYDFMFGDAVKGRNLDIVTKAQSDVNYVPRMKEGGEVSGAGGPKDDKVKMTLQERSFVVPAENADKAEALRKKYLGKTTKKMKSGGNVPVKLSDGEHVFTPEERDVLESNGVDLTALAPNAKEDDFNLKHGGSVPKGYQDGGGISGNAITIGGGDAKPSKKYQIGISEEERMAEMTHEEQRAYEQSKIYGGLTQEAWAVRKQAEKDAALAEAATEREKAAIQQQYADIFNAAKLQTITPEERAAAENADKKNKLLKVSDALGGATGALALAQIGLGLGQTLSGKRPKFKVDSEFLGRVGDALKSEKSGLPEATKTAALNKLDLGRKALTNYATSISGGNTGTAFAAAKEAAGQEAAGIVELASRDAMMQLQKKSRTDSLVSHLQGLKRQAFEDDLNAFSQNQQAGAQLTQAGISNFSQNLQYKDFMKRWEARNPTT